MCDEEYERQAEPKDSTIKMKADAHQIGGKPPREHGELLFGARHVARTQQVTILRVLHKRFGRSRGRHRCVCTVKSAVWWNSEAESGSAKVNIHDDLFIACGCVIFKENSQTLGPHTRLFSDAQIRCLGPSEIRHEHVLAKRRVTVDERALAGRDARLLKVVIQYSSAAV